MLLKDCESGKSQMLVYRILSRTTYCFISIVDLWQRQTNHQLMYPMISHLEKDPNVDVDCATESWSLVYDRGTDVGVFVNGFS